MFRQKLLCSIPFGILLAIVYVGVSGSPYIFISYVLIFTIGIAYPLVCLIWRIWRQLRLYYELWKYRPDEEPSYPPIQMSNLEKEEIEEKETEREVCHQPTFPPISHKLNRSLFATYIERKPSLRRSSTLPAIRERDTEDDE